MSRVLRWRWTFFLTGLMICALGISMTIKGQRFGIGPWDVFHVGLYNNFGFTIGTWSIITGLLIVLCTALVLKEWPKLGTWLNMILLGFFIDLFNWVLPDVESFTAQLIVFIVGIIILSFGIGFYMSPNMGAGPRDSLMLIFVEKFGVSIKSVRTSIEVVVAILGWLLGGPVGIGTVFIALFIGQFVHYSLPLSRKLLMRVIGEEDDSILYNFISAKSPALISEEANSK